MSIAETIGLAAIGIHVKAGDPPRCTRGVGQGDDERDCGRVATHDVIGVCPVGGGEWVRHWCARHVRTYRRVNLVCPAHPEREHAAQIVAVYPRGGTS